MNINETLAAWSNLLIYSAMAIYAIAFIVYSFDLFGGRKIAGSRTEQQDLARLTRPAKRAESPRG